MPSIEHQIVVILVDKDNITPKQREQLEHSVVIDTSLLEIVSVPQMALMLAESFGEVMQHIVTAMFKRFPNGCLSARITIEVADDARYAKAERRSLPAGLARN